MCVSSQPRRGQYANWKSCERPLGRVLRAEHRAVRQRGDDDEHDRGKCGKRDQRLRTDPWHAAVALCVSTVIIVLLYFMIACITAFSNSGRMSRTGV